MIASSWMIAAALLSAEDKLNFEERVEITRGLMAEYATAKVILPRSKKALPFEAATGKYDKAAWSDAGKSNGPAARATERCSVGVELGSIALLFPVQESFDVCAFVAAGLVIHHPPGSTLVANQAIDHVAARDVARSTLRQSAGK